MVADQGETGRVHGRFVGGIEDRVLVPTECMLRVSLRLD
jgi:hypothetical protein